MINMDQWGEIMMSKYLSALSVKFSIIMHSVQKHYDTLDS